MTSVIDLTERQKAEEELRESEDRYRAVVEQAAESLVLFDVDSKRVLEVSVACQTLLGYIPEAILRLTLYYLGPYPRELSTNSAYLCGIREGDRRDSNPRPSEPQSADICFQVLPMVAESAYLCLFSFLAVAQCF